MVEHTKVSRLATNEDRIANCPQLGCETIKRVKPLRLGFLGFGKYPKCTQHYLPLVYIDERIGEVVDASLACLFDRAGLPSKALLLIIKEKFPKELNNFINNWVYCITIGRGSQIISSYMDSLSNSYLKQLTKKQLKILEDEDDSKIKSGRKKSKVFDAIKRGMEEISLQFTRLLKHLRAHYEVLVNIQEILPISTELRNVIYNWFEAVLKEERKLLKIEEKQYIPLSQVKEYYDKILNLGTCRCLLGLSPVEKSNRMKSISAFDRFFAYLEFWREDLTKKFTNSDINNLKNTKIISQNSSSVLAINKNNPLFTVQISRSEVELLWYENFKRNYVKFYPILFEKVDIVLENMIKSYRFPLYLDEASPKFAKKYLSIY